MGGEHGIIDRGQAGVY